MPLDWTLVGSMINGTSSGDLFGQSVSLSADGNTMAIGAIGTNGASGSVSVYDWINSSWTIRGSSIVGLNQGDFLGISISLSSDGNTVAIGAIGVNGQSGSACVYDWINSSWTIRGLSILGLNPNDRLGSSISLSSDGNTVAIGARGENGSSGSAGVYDWINSSWTIRGSSIVGLNQRDLLGTSISLSADGNTVAIGSTGTNARSGSAGVYDWINSSWVIRGSNIFGANLLDQLGYSISLSSDGNTVAIGAYGVNGYSGSAGVYDWINSSWTIRGSSIIGLNPNDSLGTSVSLSADGTSVAIGSPGFNNLSGSVSVFTYPNIVSNICFPKGTQITTDQGIVAIDKINTKIHTIRGNKIIAITKTTSQEKYLVCFEKDSLGENIPSCKTIMSQNHCVFYEKTMRKAKWFLYKFENIKRIKYTGETLYNVLLETHNKMIVNNLICETLCPKTDIARLYTMMYFLDKFPHMRDNMNAALTEYLKSLSDDSKKGDKKYNTIKIK